MRLARRRFFVKSALGLVVARALPAYAEPVLNALPAAPQARDAVTLRAYVDTLIPADETPSGTALGVDQQLLNVAGGQPDYQRLLDLGLTWLNQRARANYDRDFPDQGEREREAVVSQAADAGFHTLPRVFFERTRADAFFHYYGRPESWRGIRYYRGPPQPLGFMDYTQPPRPLR